MEDTRRWRVVRFAAVGTIGFLIDSGLLLACAFDFGWNLLVARALSFGVAASTTWALNRVLTFTSNAESARDLSREWVRYLLACGCGGAVNYLIFVLAVELSALVARHPVTGVAMGSIGGMSVNYVLYSIYVFRSDRQFPGYFRNSHRQV